MKFNNINVHISERANIHKDVKIGDNVTIYDNVEIMPGTIISNHCVIGEPLSRYYDEGASYENPVTRIKKNSLIRSHTIIYAGSSFGEGFQTGHRVTIREKSNFGEFCSVGTLSDIQGYCSVGNYSRFHSNVHIGQQSIIGNYVFIYPYVVLTNDPTPPSEHIVGPNIGDYSQIATSSVVLPGIKIGEHSLVGAGTVVSKNVDAYSLVVGAPGKILKDVREIKDRKTGEPYYPWPQRFSRGMPWENIGFEQWSKSL